MVRGKTLEPQDLKDIVQGACILGSGGGGPLAIAEQLLAALQKMDAPVLVAPSEVGDNERMAVSAVIGSPDAVGTGPFPYQIATIAYDKLAAETGADFTCVLAGETGAGNSLIPLIVAASKQIPMVDADGARRAIPLLTMVTYASHNLPPSPLVLANSQQNVVFDAATAALADPTSRGIISSGTWTEDAGLAFWNMDGATMKKAAIPGTLTYARELGAALRMANASGHDPVGAVCNYLSGRVLFRGKLKSIQQQTQGGFDFGTVVFTATAGDTEAWIYNQNENLVLWSTAQTAPLATAPDLICYVTSDGETFTNADIQMATPGELERIKQKEFALIGAPCAVQMRAPSIVAAFVNLFKQLGYAGPYVPVEDLQSH